MEANGLFLFLRNSTLVGSSSLNSLVSGSIPAPRVPIKNNKFKDSCHGLPSSEIYHVDIMETVVVDLGVT